MNSMDPTDNAQLSKTLREGNNLKGLGVLDKNGRLCPLVGTHPKMKQIYDQILLWAPTSASILVTGETGCGKELVAQALHDFSNRSAGPFVAFDCCTMPHDLIDSALFGHEKGAFTGANTQHVGHFERANKGTLFLDEISNLSMEMQAKLLRVLQTRKFERVGGTKEVYVDVRIVAASNRPLEDCCAKGSFREDLMHRINTGVIELPPLRERSSDIPLLSKEFLKQFRTQYMKDIEGFSQEAMDALCTYRWPGNVRELRNVIERVVILTPDAVVQKSVLPPTISSPNGESPEPTILTPSVVRRIANEPKASELPPTLPQVPANFPNPPKYTPYHPSLPQVHTSYQPPQHSPSPEQVAPAPLVLPPPSKLKAEDGFVDGEPRLFVEINKFEKDLIVRTLSLFHGNIASTAIWLGVSRTTIYKKMERYGIGVTAHREIEFR